MKGWPCFRHPWGSPIHPSVIRGPALPSVGFSFSSFFIRVIRVIRGPFFLLLSPAPVIGFQATHNCATVFGLDRKLAICCHRKQRSARVTDPALIVSLRY